MNACECTIQYVPGGAPARCDREQGHESAHYNSETRTSWTRSPAEGCIPPGRSAALK